jgi:hypothetical protein
MTPAAAVESFVLRLFLFGLYVYRQGVGSHLMRMMSASQSTAFMGVYVCAQPT